MKKPAPATPPVARQLSLQAVIDAVLEHGPISRVQLAKVTGLSKQTMSEVVRDLENEGWLRVGGRGTGSVGRRAVMYEFDEAACYVVGVDLGGSSLRVAIASMSGKIAVEAEEDTDRRGGLFALDQIAELVSRLIRETGIDRSRLRRGVIAVSGFVHHGTGAVLAASNIPGIGTINFAGELEARLGIPLTVENAVDMATRGEQWQGSARGIDNFCFVAHGAGIGMGAIIGGKLLKGRKGAVGEIAFLPIGANPFDSRKFSAGTLESEVGAAAMVEKFESYGGFSGASVRDIFDAAQKAYDPAVAVVAESARMVALAIASVVAVLDPEVVIMGGQIGVRPEMIDAVRRYIPRCTPLAPEINPTALGARAQLVGAVFTASELAYEETFGVSAGNSVRLAPRNGA
ncbi:ROK family transcriptional regulator [Frigidibacter sp. ROC022]|uniref:ROK family transcriptional regulator n=1 Tax=Frigidibacter sp. ROC022 TaxID=2971796 RepID=UPI00215B6B05|nr:ROK family transcriptional regulator [Frigidibacter sp. ROC022]MCR8722705.1 ROK family transcriptional regulator [Frigidibacter sp. ROC022]